MKPAPSQPTHRNRTNHQCNRPKRCVHALTHIKNFLPVSLTYSVRCWISGERCLWRGREIAVDDLVDHRCDRDIFASWETRTIRPQRATLREAQMRRSTRRRIRRRIPSLRGNGGIYKRSEPLDLQVACTPRSTRVVTTARSRVCLGSKPAHH